MMKEKKKVNHELNVLANHIGEADLARKWFFLFIWST